MPPADKLDTERVATNKRIARVEFLTEKVLGPWVAAVDAEF